MASNVQKQSLALTIPTHVQNKIEDALQKVGKDLPCHVTAVNSNGSVTVAFDLTDPTLTLPTVTLAVAQSRYFRNPIQVGDLGVTRAADSYIGGVTGLGGGTAQFGQRANLATLVFSPVGNANWPAMNDPNKAQMGGPNGAYIADLNGRCIINVGTAGIIITVPSGDKLVVNGTLDVEGGPIINNGTTVTVP